MRILCDGMVGNSESESMSDEETPDEILASILQDADIEPVDLPQREHISREDINVSPFDEFTLIPREGTDYAEPWAQYPDEPSEQYERFLWYRDQGPGRSVVETERHFELAPKSIRAGQYEWQLRATQYDAHLDRVYRLKLQEAVREMAERHAETMVSALHHLTLPFQAIEQAMKDNPDFIKKLSKTNVLRLFDMAVKAAKAAPSLMTAERLARNQPTEIVKAEGEIRHVHEISAPEQLAEVIAILDRNHALAIGGGQGSPGEIVEAEVVEVHDDDADAEADSVSAS